MKKKRVRMRKRKPLVRFSRGLKIKLALLTAFVLVTQWGLIYAVSKPH